MSKKTEILLESGTNELELLEFTIAGNFFGINVTKIHEIMQYQNITAMPNATPYVEGVFKPRNTIMTVFDLASYMNLPPSAEPERDILIITNFSKTTSAFHVHTVEGIHRISWKDIEKPNVAIYGGDGIATGIAHFEDRLITIIDFEKIMGDISPSSGFQPSDVKTLGNRSRINKPILIAEDSPLLSNLILESLAMAGYTNVITCTNGKEAWDQLVSLLDNDDDISNHVKCIITDIEMPQMDGHHLLKLIRETPRLQALPVIIFSSLINEHTYKKGVELGASAQITKPEIAALVSIIDKHILP